MTPENEKRDIFLLSKLNLASKETRGRLVDKQMTQTQVKIYARNVCNILKDILGEEVCYTISGTDILESPKCWLVTVFLKKDAEMSLKDSKSISDYISLEQNEESLV